MPVEQVCLCVCCKKRGETYCDDIQDAEEAVDTVSGVNLLHNTFFAILSDRKKDIPGNLC